MINRERIINTITGLMVDRLPFFFYFPPWKVTIERWKREGMDPQKSWDDGPGFDAGFVHLQVNLGYEPAFEFQVPAEKASAVVEGYGRRCFAPSSPIRISFMKSWTT